MRSLSLFTVDSDWPLEEPPYSDDVDDPMPLELDDECWEALTPDDDYEPMPDYGDFWTEDD